MNTISMSLLTGLLVLFVTLPLYAGDYVETVVVEVPAGKKVVLVDENAPMACFSVKGWKMHPLPDPVGTTDGDCPEEGQLVISPGVCTPASD